MPEDDIDHRSLQRIPRGTTAVALQLPSTVVDAVQELGVRRRSHARGAVRLANFAVGAGVAGIVLYLLAGQFLPTAQVSAIGMAAQRTPTSKTARDYAARGATAAAFARSAALLALTCAAALAMCSAFRATVAAALGRRTARVSAALRAVLNSK